MTPDVEIVAASPLRHMALSVFLNRMLDAPETCGLAMITAYYDDSGSHGNTKALVICGFVSSIDQWLFFERDWNDVLRMPQFDLEHLHMKELRNGKGRFAKFRDNPTLQRDLFERLQNTLRVRTERTFAASIMLDDYDNVNADFKLRETVGPPVVVAAEFAIVRTMAWWKTRHKDQPIRIVVDQGLKNFALLDRRIYQRYGFRIIPAKVSETPPLQGCDHAAWEIHRVLNDMAKGTLKEPRHIRGSFRALLEKLNIMDDSDADIDSARWVVLDEAEIRRVSNLAKLPTRQ